MLLQAPPAWEEITFEINELCKDPNVRKLNQKEIRTRLEEIFDWDLENYRVAIGKYVLDILKKTNEDLSEEVLYLIYINFQLIMETFLG